MAPVARRSIGGFDIVATTADDLVALLRRRRDENLPTELMFANTNFVLECRSMTHLLHTGETVIVNDGIGVDLASWLFYRRAFPANLAGTDFVPFLLKHQDRPARVFLLGARPAAVQATASVWKGAGIDVVGTVDGYEGMRDDDALMRQIEEASPDILLVALGDPRQARWIVSHRGRHAVPLVVAVGALFDFVSTTVPRAPMLVRKLRLEWAYRLMQEPRRLLRRYSVDLVAFFAHCFATDRRNRATRRVGTQTQKH